MSDWCLIEYKRVYCLMFLWAVDLKTHKVFLDKNFGEYLNYVTSFVKSCCVLHSKLIWSRSTILSENGLTALNLWSGQAISLNDYSIYFIDFEILGFYVLLVYSIGFSRVVTSHAHSRQLIEILKVRFSIYMV